MLAQVVGVLLTLMLLIAPGARGVPALRARAAARPARAHDFSWRPPPELADRYPPNTRARFGAEQAFARQPSRQPSSIVRRSA